ncbi:phosphoribosylformylglycinamidine synthase subunit PurS [Marinibaculum pumilum]|uniref:Phosphoribosylformylglycinamidine synthase subunit PurS n=1 Tax=Marinibaculum pumilum TaxID=1766165 RepID=A0ABV7L3W1_9PROT
MKARVHVTLKPGVLDPQGRAINHALHSLGFDQVGDVRQGKFFDIDLGYEDRDAAEAAVKEMCDRLLANPVVESYAIEIDAP